MIKLSLKELRYYPDGEHVCANYLDEVLPYSVDFFARHLDLDERRGSRTQLRSA